MNQQIKYFLRGILILLCILTIFPVFATNTANDDPFNQQNYQWKWWLNIGPVLGGSKKNSTEIYSASGVGFNSSLNIIPFSHQLLTLSTTAEGWVGAAWIVGMLVDSDSTSDTSLLYGFISKNDIGYFSLSTGISRVHFESDQEFSFGDDNALTIKHSKITVGLPFQTQLFWTPFKYMGFGIVAYANVNHTKNFYGGGLSIQVGDLK